MGVLSWLVCMPECQVYEGNHLCGYWRDWMESGRKFYGLGRIGDKEWAQEVRRKCGGRIKYPDINASLKRMLISPLRDVFYVKILENHAPQKPKVSNESKTNSRTF